MLHLLFKLVETKLEERVLNDKLKLTVEIHPRQDQEKAHTAWLRDVKTPQGAALQCKYSLAAFDAKAPFYALLTVQDETGKNRVASASLDLGPLRNDHTAGLADAQVSLRTPKGAKAFILQVSVSYDGSHDDDQISDNSSEAGEDDVRAGDDPNATDDSSEAEEDDVPADETGKDLNADEKDASALFTDDSSEADEDDVRPGDDVYGTDDSSEASEDDVLEEVPEAESPKAAGAKQNPRQKEKYHSENDSEESEDDIDDDDDIASDDRQSESYGSASFADAESELKMPLVPTVDTCKESLPLQSGHLSQTSGAWEALYRVDRFETAPGQAKPKVNPVPPRRPKAPKASLPATPISNKDRARRRKSQEETSAFLKRMDQRAEQKRHAAKDLQARLDYEATLRKKVCPQCGRTQSFEQVKKRQKKCIECKVLFRYSVRWDQVKDDFMDRNTVAPKRPEADQISRRQRPSRANKDFLARMDKAAERRRQRNMQQQKSTNQEKSTSQEKSHEHFAQDKRKPAAKEPTRPRLPGKRISNEPPFDRDLWTAEQIVIAHLFGPCESCHLDERCE